jgi:hypothetical protein
MALRNAPPHAATDEHAAREPLDPLMLLDI